jgi:hypothetical protein
MPYLQKKNAAGLAEFPQRMQQSALSIQLPKSDFERILKIVHWKGGVTSRAN